MRGAEPYWHHDFKPSNAMIVEGGVDDGRVKVLDVGLGRAALPAAPDGSAQANVRGPGAGLTHQSGPVSRPTPGVLEAARRRSRGISRPRRRARAAARRSLQGRWTGVSDLGALLGGHAAPRQDVTTRGQPEYGENFACNIWRVTEEHRPVGSIAEARKVVYAASAEQRRDANGVPTGETAPARPGDDPGACKDRSSSGPPPIWRSASPAWATPRPSSTSAPG